MNVSHLLHTLLHLRPQQVFYQLFYRLHKPQYKTFETPEGVVPELQTEPIPRCHCLDDKTFTFLNLSHEFSSWDFNEYGNLWTYNQNYFDWLNQEGMTSDEGCQWIDLFIFRLSTLASRLLTLNSQPSLDPYPIALRSINWIKFFCQHPECATKPRLDSLYSQIKLLERKLEYHLLGNHLLEDAYALYMAAAFFQDLLLQKKATKLLMAQLKEQTLSDGAHYEQSPMYHCILLDRLLDCINIAPNDELKVFAKKQIGWLKSICYQDGSFPLFNDAAYGIAQFPKDIIDYAQRLGIESDATPLGDSGYRKLSNNKMEAIVDVGNITASYQPGHTHADTLNYELRIGGRPVVVDTGISTYNKNERRQMERSTIAHNCVSPDGLNSSEVWGGFRVGKRAKVSGERLTVSGERMVIEAMHNGFGNPCRRRFEMAKNKFIVEDWFDGEATSYVHLAESVDVNRLTVSGDGLIDIQTKPWQYSTEYNRFHNGTVLAINFSGHICVTFR